MALEIETLADGSAEVEVDEAETRFRGEPVFVRSAELGVPSIIAERSDVIRKFLEDQLKQPPAAPVAG